jgi:TetR/AcrR family transcriptional regulator, transcriptional repressor for nem operon
MALALARRHGQGAGDEMARPREFDESAVLDAAALCFWKQGYEATSVRDLVEHTGIAAASLYNAFGDKRALYEKALDHYVEESIADRIRRCRSLPPLQAIEAFFNEIMKRSLDDRDRKGCMLVNAALEGAPNDPAFRTVVANALIGIESFFLACVSAGQADGSIARSLPANTLAQGLLGALMGVRVLARARPERGLLVGVAAAALAQLRVSRCDVKS